MDAIIMSLMARSAAALVVNFLRSTLGATASEFALVVPVFLTLVFGTINTGLAMSAITQMHYAAERSARCLSVDVTASCKAANIDTFAKGLYNGPNITGLTFVATTQSCGNRVVGSGSYNLLNGFGSTSVTFNAEACYPII